MKKAVEGFALFAIIDNYWPAYSISSVVRNQLLGLQDIIGPFPFINLNGGECPEEFKGERRWVDRMHLEDWFAKPVGHDWEENATKLVPSMRKALEGVTVLLVNDVLMQGWYLPYLWALRKVLADRPDLQVYHLIHSGPSPRRELEYPRSLLYELHEQEVILYNNASDIPWVQAMYDTPRVLPVRNPVSMEDFFDMTPNVLTIYREMNLEDADIITMYPTRISEGKQVDKWLGVIAGLKANGAKVRGIIANSYSNTERERKVIQNLVDQARADGLVKGKDFCFTSELCDAPIGLDRRDISQLNRLCNVFIQTSLSETCSLIMLEAMACRQILVLNMDVDCNLSGELMWWGAVAGRFGGLHRKTEYSPSFSAYCKDLARNIMNRVAESPEQLGFLRALQLHNRRIYAAVLLNTMGLMRVPPFRRTGILDLPYVRNYQPLNINHMEKKEGLPEETPKEDVPMQDNVRELGPRDLP